VEEKAEEKAEELIAQALSLPIFKLWRGLMKGILAIYRREMSSYFVSPIAYIVIGFFAVHHRLLFLQHSLILHPATVHDGDAGATYGRSDRYGRAGLRAQLHGIVSTIVLFMILCLRWASTPRSVSEGRWRC
jgi:hypothetical protein